MAFDYYKKWHGVEVFEGISIKQFKEEYDKIKVSPDKVPVASTVLPIFASDGCSLRGEKDVILYEVAIFWETASPAEVPIKATEAPKVEKKWVM
jgi:hypothetical protein